MSLLRHSLRLNHARRNESASYGSSDTDIDVDLTATSYDLVDAWREVLSRMPDDLRQALDVAQDTL